MCEMIAFQETAPGEGAALFGSCVHDVSFRDRRAWCAVDAVLLIVESGGGTGLCFGLLGCWTACVVAYRWTGYVAARVA